MMNKRQIICRITQRAQNIATDKWFQLSGTTHVKEREYWF